MEAEAEGKQTLTLTMVPVVCPQLSPSLLAQGGRGKRQKPGMAGRKKHRRCPWSKGLGLSGNPLLPELSGRQGHAHLLYEVGALVWCWCLCVCVSVYPCERLCE